VKRETSNVKHQTAFIIGFFWRCHPDEGGIWGKL